MASGMHQREHTGWEEAEGAKGVGPQQWRNGISGMKAYLAPAKLSKRTEIVAALPIERVKVFF